MEKEKMTHSNVRLEMLTENYYHSAMLLCFHIEDLCIAMSINVKGYLC